MKRKNMLILTSIAVGVLLLFTTAFAGLSGNSGYDMYKTAVKNMKNTKNATITGIVSLKDNGTQIFNVDLNAKADEESKAMSARAEFSVTGGKESSVEVYKTSDKVITKSDDSDVYNVITGSKVEDLAAKRAENNKVHEALQGDVEKVVDAIVGNVQNYISVDGNTVSLSISGDQINPAVNALASLAVKTAEDPKIREIRDGKTGDKSDLELNNELRDQLYNSMPKLTDDIRITNVNLKATINNNIIENQTADITISGKDATGQAHDITLSANFKLSDLNNTKPDTIDLTGKKTKEIKVTEKMRMGRAHDMKW